MTREYASRILTWRYPPPYNLYNYDKAAEHMLDSTGWGKTRGGSKPMSKKRRQHSAKFKFKVALEAAKGNRTAADVASEAGVHPNLISQRNLCEDVRDGRSPRNRLGS